MLRPIAGFVLPASGEALNASFDSRMLPSLYHWAENLKSGSVR